MTCLLETNSACPKERCNETSRNCRSTTSRKRRPSPSDILAEIEKPHKQPKSEEKIRSYTSTEDDMDLALMYAKHKSPPDNRKTLWNAMQSSNW